MAFGDLLEEKLRTDSDLRGKVDKLMPVRGYFADSNPKARDLLRLMQALEFEKYEDSVVALEELTPTPPKLGVLSQYPTTIKLTRHKRDSSTGNQAATVHEHHLFMQRALSWALGAILVVENSEGKSETARKKIDGIYEFTKIFLDRLDKLSENGHLSLSKQKKAAKMVNDFRACLAKVLLPGKKFKKEDRIAALKKADAYIAWEIPRFIQETTSRYTSDESSFFSLTKQEPVTHKLVQTTTPECSITDEIKAEWRKILAEGSEPTWSPSQEWDKRYLGNKAQAAVTAEAQGDPYAWAKIAEIKSPVESATPGACNLCRHDYKIYQIDGKITSEQETFLSGSSRYGYSAPSSRNNRKDHVVRKRHCQQNLEQIFMVAGMDIDAKSAQPSEKLLQDFFTPWGFKSVKKLDAPAHGEKLSLTLPLETTALYTPAPYEELSFFERLTGNHNIKWHRDKVAAVENIQAKFDQQPLVVEVEADAKTSAPGKSVTIKPKIYDAVFAVNGLRGWVNSEVYEHNRRVIGALFRDKAGNLVTLAKLRNLDEKTIAPFAELQRLINAADDVTELSRSELNAILEQLNKLLKDKDLPNKFIGSRDDQEPQRKDFRIMLHAYRDYIELYNIYNKSSFSITFPLLGKVRFFLFGNKRNISMDLAVLHRLLIAKSHAVAGGHCQSGRDRFGNENTAQETQEMFFHRFDELSNYYDRDSSRDEYDKRYAWNYGQGHALDQCAQNTKGCRGIKDEPTFWPLSWLSFSLWLTTLIPLGIKNHLKDFMETSKILSKMNKPATWWGAKDKGFFALHLIAGVGLATLFFLLPVFVPGAAFILSLIALGGGLGYLVAKLTGRPAVLYAILGAVLFACLPLLLPAVSTTVILSLCYSLSLSFTFSRIAKFFGYSEGLAGLLGAGIGAGLPFLLPLVGLGSVVTFFSKIINAASQYIMQGLGYLQYYSAVSYGVVNIAGAALATPFVADSLGLVGSTCKRLYNLASDEDLLDRLIKNPGSGNSSKAIVVATSGTSGSPTESLSYDGVAQPSRGFSLFGKALPAYQPLGQDEDAQETGESKLAAAIAPGSPTISDPEDASSGHDSGSPVMTAHA